MLNQKGQAITLVILGVTGAIFTAFSFYSIYWQNHLKSGVQIKVAYNLMDAVDEASKDIRSDWDNACTSSGSINPNTIKANMAPLTPNPTCAAKCPINGAVLCYDDPSNSNVPFCFYGGAMSAARIELKLLSPKAPFRIDRIMDKIASFFKSTLKSTFEEKALAQAAPARIDDLAVVNPVCVPGQAGCMTCGAGTGAICTAIYACPAEFPQCANYDGTPQKALFVQQFYLVPPGSGK